MRRYATQRANFPRGGIVASKPFRTTLKGPSRRTDTAEGDAPRTSLASTASPHTNFLPRCWKALRRWLLQEWRLLAQRTPSAEVRFLALTARSQGQS